MADLLIEIGCEELPAEQLPRLIQDFAHTVATFLQQARLGFDATQMEVFSTPRRLAVLCKDLSTEQPDEVSTRQGPSFAAAVDAQGQPTPAARGFAKACGADLAELLTGVDSSQPSKRLEATVTQAGQSAIAYLAAALPKVLMTWTGYKFMRWGEGDFSFLRPVQNITVMLDAEVVPCEIYGIAASAKLYTHRVHRPEPIVLSKAASYAEVLAESGFVLPDVAQRKALIEAGLQSQLQVGEVLEENPGLIDEVTHLVEYPQVLRANFDKRFLALPSAVIHEVVNAQQKCFLLYDDQGRLVNSFLLVANLKSKDEQAVIAGNEKVVCARLNDAKFFVARDEAQTIEAFSARLKEVIFHPKLGTVADKVARIVKMAPQVAKWSGCEAKDLSQAAHLAKFDLVTDTVQEWSKLEAVFGGYLLGQAGESEVVCVAVAEHVKPRNAHDALPASKVGLALALVDRLDTLVGFALLGVWPKADKDAYGMRRLALAVARIVVALDIDQPLVALLMLASEQHGSALDQDSMARLEGLVRDRQHKWLNDAYGAAPWIADCFLASPYVPADVQAKIDAMVQLQAMPEAEDYWALVKRVDNFLKGHSVANVSWSPLGGAAPEEVLLGQQVVEKRAQFLAWRQTRDFLKLYLALAELRVSVDAFFDKVLINVDDTEVKNNRFALIAELSRLF